MLHAEAVYMPIDFYAFVIALLSRRCVIGCCPLILHTPATSVLCIILSVAVYTATRAFRTATELQIVPMRDRTQHSEATMLAIYICSHMVQFEAVLKYRLCL